MRKLLLTVAVLLAVAMFNTEALRAQSSAAPPNVVRTPDGKYAPARGYKWANDKPGDFTVVKAGPSDEQIGKAVLKAIGALVLHEGSKPQPGDDFGDAILRGIARTARDKLIDSALEDLLPDNTAIEQAAVRGLVVLALDGRLSHDRDKVVGELRRGNPNMANAVETAEFLIRLGKAVDKKR